MRIYQLAKEIGVAGAEVLKAAAGRGFEVETVLSSLSAQEARELKDSFAKRDPAAAKAAGDARRERAAAKAARAAAIRAEAAKTRDAALADHRRIAEAAAAAASGKSAPAGKTSAASAPETAPKPAEKPQTKAVEPESPSEDEAKSDQTHASASVKKQPKKPVRMRMADEDDEDEIDDPAALRALRQVAAESKHQAGHAQSQRARQKDKEEARKEKAEEARAAAAAAAAAAQQRPGAPSAQRGGQRPGAPARPGFPQRPGAPARPGASQVRPGPAAQRPGPGARPGAVHITIGGRPSPQTPLKQRSAPRAGFQQVSISAAPVPRPTIQTAAPAAAAPVINVNSREISIRGATVVKDLAEKLGIRPNRLIADLMQLKVLASINQRVEPDVAVKVASKYGFKVVMEHVRDRGERKPVLKAIDADDEIPEDKPESMKPRPPVVTFLGHVDHGKTTLMDYIRHTKVAAGEAGGITQKISAYQVDVNGRKITFLDTPGHAAFSAMRQRGASLTDIAVIIIAADDGIMPQTEEAIKDARQAGVQIMVAITKCDLPAAKPDRVKQMLQKQGLTPEEWGGDVVCCEVSGVTGDGVDNLLEMMLLQADVLELSANPDRRANGYVVEAQLEQGFGPSAMMLVTGGTLKVGDAVLVGETFGKVRSLIDDHGRRVRAAGPSTPVKVTGLSGVPEAGAEFRVMLDEKRARTLASEAALARKTAELSSARDATSLGSLLSRMQSADKRELNVIVKADTRGSLEAIVEALNGIKSEKVSLKIIGESAGNVSINDVKEAAAGKAAIVGFDVGIDSGVQQQARHDGVRINTFRIIYELMDHVKNSMLDLLPPEYREAVKGHAEIKAVYDIGKVGRIAGCQMLDGSLLSSARYRVFRGGEKLWEGKLSSLRHFKDEVKEVTGQQECGVCFENFEKFGAGDTVECYTLEELPRSL